MHSACTQLELVLNPVIDELSGGARANGSLCNCLRDDVNQTWVERRWDDVVGSERHALAFVSAGHLIRDGLTSELSESQSSGHLHVLVDLSCTGVQSASEQEGETHDVVDLVRVVRATRSDNRIVADCLGVAWADLGLWVGHRKDDWVVSHLVEVLWLESACG